MNSGLSVSSTGETIPVTLGPVGFHMLTLTVDDQVFSVCQFQSMEFRIT